MLDTQHAADGLAATNQPLTEIEAAARLGLKVATLRAWRSQGRVPHTSASAARFGTSRPTSTTSSSRTDSFLRQPTVPSQSSEVSHGIQKSMAEYS